MEKFKKYLYISTLALFIYMPFHIFISQYLSVYTGGLDFWKIAKDIFTVLLVSVLVCTTLITKKYTKQYLIFVGFAVVYFILHVILWLGTNQPNDTALLATIYNNRLVWYLLIGYSIALLLPKKDSYKVFAKILIAVSTVVCLIGLAQWVLPKDIMTHFGYSIERGVKPNFFIDDKPDFPRIMSTIRDPNSLGAFLLLPTAIITSALIRFWETPRRMLLVGLLMLHCLAILLTFSRGAWLGLIAMQVAIFTLIFRNNILAFVKKFAVPIVLLTLILIGLTYVSKDSYFFQNVILHSDESTQLADPNELRVQLAKKGIEGIAADPEGRGPGMAGLVSTRLPNGLLTENYYLQIAYEVGVIGLIMLIAFLAYLFRILIRGRNDIVVDGLLASFAGLCFINLLVHGWANEAVAASWFILTGLTAGSITRKKAALRDGVSANPTMASSRAVDVARQDVYKDQSHLAKRAKKLRQTK